MLYMKYKRIALRRYRVLLSIKGLILKDKSEDIFKYFRRARKETNLKKFFLCDAKLIKMIVLGFVKFMKNEFV